MILGLGLGINLNQIKSGAFSPLSLFSASEQGVFYDCSDLTTLFTDPAGTTPVTTPGQTVGLMLDKSKGLALGAELVENGTFDVNTTGWTAQSGATLSVDTERLKVVSSGSFQGTSQSFATASGPRYQVSVTVVSATTRYYIGYGNAFGQGQVLDSGFLSGARTFTARFVGNGTSTVFWILAESPGTLLLDNISVRELAGNHATQSITASQPIYGVVPAGGRRNLLSFSEQFDNAAWTKAAGVTISPNTHGAPDGTTTADTLTSGANQLDIGVPCLASTTYTDSLYFRKTVGATYTPSLYLLFSGGTMLIYAAVVNTNTGVPTAVTAGGFTAPSNISVTDAGDYWRLSVSGASGNNSTASLRVYASFNPVSGGAGAGSQVIWGAQLEQSATATPYQRVTTQYDVTEAGVASLGYLFFDGSGDFMSTGTITPGTDKAQVFTGVRKLSNVIACISELSADTNANIGSIALFTSTIGFETASRGTAPASGSLAASVSASAPTSAVLAATHDISGDLTALRLNGGAAATATAEQGTGNFLTYPLYIGRRGGTTFPFSGHIHSLIVRFGPNLTTARISATESWVASKTAGVTL